MPRAACSAVKVGAPPAATAAVSVLSVLAACVSVVLALAAWAAGDSFGGYTAQTWLMLLLLAIFPQIIGHSLMNWSLRHVSPTMVTVSNLAEPIFATILAYFVLAETPTPVKAIGGMLVLGGIYVTMQGERQKETPRA